MSFYSHHLNQTKAQQKGENKTKLKHFSIIMSALEATVRVFVQY